MTAPLAEPTPYAEVNAVLQELLGRVQAILGEEFVGLYLYGSLASGDFDLLRSDIDFVVVTSRELPEPLIASLEAMHMELAASNSKWARKLEGAYVPRQALRRYDPAAPPRPTVNEGRFYLDQQGSDWVIQRHILRNHGVVLAGPPPDWLIDLVRPEEIRQAVLEILQGWWAPMVREPGRLQSREYQAYAVLSMCRALHTLQQGSVVSKSEAARWAIEELEPEWGQMIERALEWPRGDQPDGMDETLEFIRYTLSSAGCYAGTNRNESND